MCLARRMALFLALCLSVNLFVAGVAEAAPMPKLANVVTASPPAQTHVKEAVVVLAGDTLWALARHNGTSVIALQRLNGLGHSTRIYAGQRLRLPHHKPRAPIAGGAGDSATVRPGQYAVSFARRQLGLPYRWGGTGSDGFDCSGLVQAAWRTAGVFLPRTTYAQMHAGVAIHRGKLRLGDLVFTRQGGHVQLYAGSGKVIEAAGLRVRFSSLPSPQFVDLYIRPTGSGPSPK
ncbi:C40 family peptidase [Streptomyces sp. NPDC048362]|uniref:C40 family peptidase n=1 Tax=Streptomyces sp. NPDC048362 TaxID=3365539 RepID=UPI003721C0FB